MKRHMGQDMGGFQTVLCALFLEQGTSPSQHNNVFTDREAPLSFNAQSFHWGFIT